MVLPGLVAAGLLVVLAAGSLVAFLLAARAVGPPDPDVTPDPPYESVTVPRMGGPDLAAWWAPSHAETDSAVLCVHGHPRSKAAILETVRFLRDDHHLLLLDLRAHGDSDGTFTTFGKEEVRDVQAALSLLQDRPEVERMGAWGVSMGASSLVMARDPRLEAVVAEAPFADLLGAVTIPGPGFLDIPIRWAFDVWARLLLNVDPKRVRPEDAAGDLPFPVLLVHGTADATVPVDHGHRIAAAGGDAVTPWFVEGAGHDDCHDHDPEAYEARVGDFLREHLAAAEAGGGGDVSGED